MNMFLQCVAEAFVEEGLHSAADLVPGGGAIFKFGKAVWDKWCKKRKDADEKKEIEQIVKASEVEVKKAVHKAAKDACANQPETSAELETYLTQVQESIRESLKRDEDPTGNTVPKGFTLRSADDVARLLPTVYTTIEQVGRRLQEKYGERPIPRKELVDAVVEQCGCAPGSVILHGICYNLYNNAITLEKKALRVP